MPRRIAPLALSLSGSPPSSRLSNPTWKTAMRMTPLATFVMSFFLAVGAAAAAPASSPAATTSAASMETAQSAPSAADAQFADLSKRWLDGSMRLSP
ncbi:MAG TPA: hypothetical protein VK753_06090, partial [Xanthomonadaceae bacterium]|nr:hypothetical protein [Xanthomonadaceae bacterium]